jgi:predicted nicotinamide N-methyase
MKQIFLRQVTRLDRPVSWRRAGRGRAPPGARLNRAARPPYARQMTAETERLVWSATSLVPVPFVPEVTLRTAAEPFALWDRTERDAPPFWAFPWAGGQGLARYVLDHPDTVAGRRVLDVASGSGLVAIAAAKAGAAEVLAGDIDDNALAVIALNAAANEVPAVTPCRLDLEAAGPDPAGCRDGGPGPAPDLVLAADVCYQREMAAAALRFLRAARRAGADVLLADPGRSFLPRAALTAVAAYQVPVLTVLEDAPVKPVTVYRLT